MKYKHKCFVSNISKSLSIKTFLFQGLDETKRFAKEYATKAISDIKGKFYLYQGQGNYILTNNSKGKFPHNPLPLFLPFFPTPLQLHDKNKIYHQILYKVS